MYLAVVNGVFDRESHCFRLSSAGHPVDAMGAVPFPNLDRVRRPAFRSRLEDILMFIGIKTGLEGSRATTPPLSCVKPEALDFTAP
jgi:hypothetical protein